MLKQDFLASKCSRFHLLFVTLFASLELSIFSSCGLTVFVLYRMILGTGSGRHLRWRISIRTPRSPSLPRAPILPGTASSCAGRFAKHSCHSILHNLEVALGLVYSI